VMFLQNSIYFLSRSFNWVAAGAVIAMILLVCMNVITRLFGYPIMGTFELVEVLLVIGISFSLSYGSLTDCHPSINLLTRKLSQRAQAIIDIITSFISLGLFGLIGWRCVMLASRIWKTGELSITLWIPLFPFLYGVALNCVIVCLVILLKDIPRHWQVIKK
jgi:TRAP-type C4-dicarboxylate transport system permease small subunit